MFISFISPKILKNSGKPLYPLIRNGFNTNYRFLCLNDCRDSSVRIPLLCISRLYLFDNLIWIDVACSNGFHNQVCHVAGFQFAKQAFSVILYGIL